MLPKLALPKAPILPLLRQDSVLHLAEADTEPNWSCHRRLMISWTLEVVALLLRYIWMRLFCLQLEASYLQLSFFTYGFLLTIGSFLLTVELLYLQLCCGPFVYSWSFSTYNWSFFAYN